MQIATIQGEVRKPGGRHANERLRRRGLIPAVVYGHGEAPETIALVRHDLDLALENHSHVIEVKLDARSERYLIKEVQYDHLQKDALHVDLMRVDAEERVEVKVAIELKGTPIGVREGGELHHLITDLDIECGLLEIPDVIRVNVADLAIGQALHVGELQLPPGVKALDSPDTVVCAVRLKKVAAAAPAAAPEGEAAPAEPEVIGRVAKEESEGE